MAVKTKVTLKNVKIKQILDTSSTKPWGQLSADLQKGASNPLIANSAAGPMIGTFSSVVSAINPFFTVSKVIEIVKPIVGTAVKIIGSFLNPGFIADLAQDAVGIIQSVILQLIVYAVTQISETILNTQISLKDITREQMESLQNGIQSLQKKSEKTVDNVFNNFSYSCKSTNASIDLQQTNINQALTNVKNAINTNIDNLNTSGMTADQARAAILQIIKDGLSGTELVILIPSDEELFLFVDTEIKNMVKALEVSTAEALKELSVDTAEIEKELDGESLQTFKEVKDGFTQMAVGVVQGNKEGIFEAASYKENYEIEALVLKLKDLINEEVKLIKKRFYEDIERFISETQNIEVMKTTAKTTVIVTVDIYELFKRLFEQELQNIRNINAELTDLFSGESDLALYYKQFNEGDYNIAKNLFSVYIVELIKYLLAGEYVFKNTNGYAVAIDKNQLDFLLNKDFLSSTNNDGYNSSDINNVEKSIITRKGYKVSGTDLEIVKEFLYSKFNFKNISISYPNLENNQIIVSSNFLDVKTLIINYINSLVSFDKNIVFNSITNIIALFNIDITFNTSIAENLRVCYKTNVFKTNVYKGYREQMEYFYETVPEVFGQILFPKVEEDNLRRIKLYFKMIVKEHLEKIMTNVIKIVIDENIHCKNCLSSESIKINTIQDINYNIYRMKRKVVTDIYKDYNEIPFTVNFTENKTLLLNYFNSSNFTIYLENQINEYYSFSKMNEIFQDKYKDDEKKIFDIIVKEMDKI